MVEENSRTGKQPISFPVICHLPKGGRFCDRVGAPGSERRFFICRRAFQVAETFAGRGVVKPDLPSSEPDSLKQVQSRHINALLGFDRLLKRQ